MKLAKKVMDIIDMPIDIAVMSVGELVIDGMSMVAVFWFLF
jgi:hypothetical protein